MDLGEDIDGDGISETFDANSVVTVIGFETVTVPAGTFSNCVKIKTKVTEIFTISSSGQKITGTGDIISWFASGVGFIKSTYVITVDNNVTKMETEELIGYDVDGQSIGDVGGSELAPNLSSITKSLEKRREKRDSDLLFKWLRLIK